MDFFDRPKIRNYDGEPIRFVQDKMDGFYCEVYKCAELGTMAFLRSRKENVASLLPPLPHIPNDSILLGELHCPGVPATSVITMMQEHSPKLCFSPFAVPMWCGYDCSTIDYNDFLKYRGFNTPSMFMEYTKPTTPNVEKLLNSAVKRKVEGYVLKVSHLSGWYKLKPRRTVDAFVVGYTISKSLTYFGELKGFTVAVRDGNGSMTIANVGSGLTAEFKHACKPEQWLGKVMEVEYQSVASKGRLQFPHFLQWREDKKASECTMEQLK
jgi:hypothetical protein